MSHEDRIRRFQELLGAAADLAFFPVSSDLQYLTGIPRPIPNYGAEIHTGSWLMGAWFAPGKTPILTLPRMMADFGGYGSSDAVDVRVLGDWDDPATMVRTILKDFDIGEKPRVAISDWTEGETVSRLAPIIPGASFLSATDILRTMRVIKSPEEIEVMRRAGQITEAAFADVLKQLRHGMTELEVVMEVDYQLRKHGALGPSFTTSLYNSGPGHPVKFGKSLETWKRVLNPPVSILFDFGAAHDGFCYDFGRTVFFGEPDATYRNMFELIMGSQTAGIAAMRAGEATTSEVDAVARQVIIDGGHGDRFRHRLGHGIGMDVHEPPYLVAGNDTLLQEGMMFTVEPSIMAFDHPDDFSCRVEDVVVARPGGGEPLTSGFRQMQVIE